MRYLFALLIMSLVFGCATSPKRSHLGPIPISVSPMFEPCYPRAGQGVLTVALSDKTFPQFEFGFEEKREDTVRFEILTPLGSTAQSFDIENQGPVLDLGSMLGPRYSLPLQVKDGDLVINGYQTNIKLKYFGCFASQSFPKHWLDSSVQTEGAKFSVQTQDGDDSVLIEGHTKTGSLSCAQIRRAQWLGLSHKEYRYCVTRGSNASSSIQIGNEIRMTFGDLR